MSGKTAQDGGPRATSWAEVVRLRTLPAAVAPVILGAGAVGMEYLVRGQVDAAVRSALPGLSEDARIATKGIVLRQVVGGSLDSLSVDSPSLKITSKGQSGT